MSQGAQFPPQMMASTPHNSGTGPSVAASTEVQAQASNTQHSGMQDPEDKHSIVTSQRTHTQPYVGSGRPQWLQTSPEAVPHQPGPAVSLTQEVPRRQLLPLPPRILQDISAFLNGAAAAQIPLQALSAGAVPPHLAAAMAAAHDGSFRLETGTHDFASLVRDAVWRLFPGSPEVCHAMVQMLLGAVAANSSLCAFHARYAGCPPMAPEISVSPGMLALFSPMGQPPFPLVQTASSLTSRASTTGSKAWGRGATMHISPTAPLPVPHNHITGAYMNPTSLHVRQAAGARAASEQADLLHVCSVFQQAAPGPSPTGHAPPLTPLTSFSARETVSMFWSTWNETPRVDGVFSVIERVVPLAAAAVRPPALQLPRSAAAQAAQPTADAGSQTPQSVPAGMLVRIPVPDSFLVEPGRGSRYSSSQTATTEPSEQFQSEQQNGTQHTIQHEMLQPQQTSSIPFPRAVNGGPGGPPSSSPPAPPPPTSAALVDGASSLQPSSSNGRPFLPARHDVVALPGWGRGRAGHHGSQAPSAAEAVQALSQTLEGVQQIVVKPAVPAVSLSVDSTSLEETASDALRAWGGGGLWGGGVPRPAQLPPAYLSLSSTSGSTRAEEAGRLVQASGAPLIVSEGGAGSRAQQAFFNLPPAKPPSTEKAQ